MAGYDLRYSTSPIDEASWDSATPVTGEPAPAAYGTKETFAVTGLQPGTTYYFAVKSFDYAEPANVSTLSNLVEATTMPPIQPVTVRNPWIVNDRVADTHNIGTMGATYVNAYTPDGIVLPTTDEQKAINIYNNQKRRLYHWADEPPAVGGNNIGDPTYNQNVFGWALCGRHGSMGMTVARAAGFNSRNVGITGHNIYEVEYDGRWHLYDTMTTMYVFTKTSPAHVASLAEISADHTIMTSAVADGRACPGYLLCGDDPNWYAGAGDNWGVGSTTPTTARWTGEMDLRLGQSFNRTWHAWESQHPTAKSNSDTMAGKDPPYHHEAQNDWKDTVNYPYWEPYGQIFPYIHTGKATYRRWSNGTDTLVPDFRSDAYEALLEPTSTGIATYKDDAVAPDLHTAAVGTQGEAVFKIAVPFYITDAQISGTFVRNATGDICKLYFSSNGTTWTQVYSAPVGTTQVSNLSLRANVFGLWSTWYLKVQMKATAGKSDAGVSGLVIQTIFEHNKGAMAYLDKGLNHITVTFDNPAELQASGNVLRVYYKWKEHDGSGWNTDREFETYVTASPSTFAIQVEGTKVPRTESIVMEVIPPPVDPVPPSPVTDLAAGPAQEDEVTLFWTAPADYRADNAGPFSCYSYEIRRSSSPIIAGDDGASWNAATPVEGVPSPKAPGSPESFVVTGLSGSSDYWFAIKARDTSNTSEISNIVQVHTPMSDNVAPDWVGNLRARTSKTSNAIDLTWTAPADWGYDGAGPYTCTGYELRYSSEPILHDDGGATWDAATPVTGLAAPKAPGAAESFTVSGLAGGNVYYFALRASDKRDNVAEVSNCATSKASMIGERTVQTVGVRDSYIYGGGTGTNYGGIERMSVCGFLDYGIGAVQRGVVRFDLSDLPAGAVPTQAVLSLYSYDAAQSKGTSGSYGVYPITRDWTDNGVTWDSAAAGVAWTMAGGDFAEQPDATASKQVAGGLPAANVWYSWDVTDRVAGWLAGTSANHGWVIRVTDEMLHVQDRFYQTDTASAERRPKLVISDLPAEIAGDIDEDGHVNVFDIFCIAESWNKSLGERGFDPRCDLDSDDSVNIFDIFVVAENWGR